MFFVLVTESSATSRFSTRSTPLTGGGPGSRTDLIAHGIDATKRSAPRPSGDARVVMAVVLFVIPGRRHRRSAYYCRGADRYDLT